MAASATPSVAIAVRPEPGIKRSEAAKVAKEEGFPNIAKLFNLVGSVEVDHEKRYRHLLKQVEEGKVHRRDAPTKWICRKCGYVHDGPEAPQVCPLCSHPRAYFEEKIVDY
ncbi:MAG: rubrerythrin family protein [Thermoplasmatota archaeon]